MVNNLDAQVENVIKRVARRLDGLLDAQVENFIKRVARRLDALLDDFGERLHERASRAAPLIDVNYSCRSTTTISAGSGHVLPLVPRPPSSPPRSGSCRHLRRSCRRSSRPHRSTRSPSSPVPRAGSCRRLAVVVVRSLHSPHALHLDPPRAPTPTRPGLRSIVATRARVAAPPLTRCPPSSSSTRCASSPPPPGCSPGRSR
jgi:hypothetical protein